MDIKNSNFPAGIEANKSQRNSLGNFTATAPETTLKLLGTALELLRNDPTKKRF